MRIHFEHVSNASNVLSGVLRFAAMAQAALGKSVLGIIQDDINAGRYHPGQPAVLQLGSQPALMARSMDYSHPHPYPAPQQAPRAIAVPVYPLPHHIPITAQDYSSYQAYSPPAAGHGGTGAFGGTLAITPRLPQLDQVRQNLRGAGGVDPLPAMLEHAERAVAAAGRMAPGMHQNGGVPVTWSASPGDADFKVRGLSCYVCATPLLNTGVFCAFCSSTDGTKPWYMSASLRCCRLGLPSPSALAVPPLPLPSAASSSNSQRAAAPQGAEGAARIACRPRARAAR